MEKTGEDTFLNKEFTFGGVSLTQKASFAKNLALMLNSGLDILEALITSREAATGKLNKVINSVISSIDAGNTLSSALRAHPDVFSELFVSSVLAGETSGTLVENLENLADHLNKKSELREKIKGALVYPVIVIIGALLLGAVLSFVVLPKIVPLFEGMKVQLPITTRMLIYFTHFIEKNSALLIYGGLSGALGLYWFSVKDFSKPIVHLLLLKIPIIKTLVINSSLANFCATFGVMLKSGLIIDEALLVSRNVVGNYYYKKALTEAHKSILQGTQLSDCLARHPEIFPKMVISMVEVGERSGNLEASFFNLSKFFEGEVDNATKNLSTAIEPVLLIFIGAAVGLLAVSIITPIYKLTGSVSKR